MTDLATTTIPAIVAQTLHNQFIAARPDVSVWASANAGAGKTKVLIDRIARLLLAGSQPGKILAVTYTKAAASEMQTRLYKLLGSWTIASNEQLKAVLLDLDPQFSHPGDAFLAHARALFAKALETPGGLKIQTIHAFCQTILQRFPLEAGIPPGFRTLDEAEAQHLQAQAFKLAFATEPDAFKTLARLTSQSGHFTLVKNALRSKPTFPQFPINLDRLAKELAKALEIDPEKSTETYQQEAINQLDPAALTQAATALMAGTVTDINSANKLCIMVESEDQEAVVNAWRDLVWTQEHKPKSKTKIYTSQFATHTNITDLLGGSPEAPSVLCDAFNHMQEKIRALSTFHLSMALTRATNAFSLAWSQIKQAIGVLDFDDLLTKTAALLQSGQGAAWVLYKLDAGIDHILIDEAQDTNPAQWDLLAPLFANLEQDKRTLPRTRFIVGDEKQSIYSFQGAMPERYLQEKASFEAGAATFADGRVSLEFDLSFRSGQTILNAVDAVWAHASQQMAAADGQYDPIFCDDETKFTFPTHHLAFRDQHVGVVELWPLTVSGDKSAEREAWDHPLNIEREDSSRNRLADRIAGEIKARLDNRFMIPTREGSRAMTAGDIMILVKRRGLFFHQLIKRLKFHKVPVAGTDRIRLNEDPAVMDLVALARFALLPQDDFNLACVLKGAFCGLIDDDKHLFPLAYDRQGSCLWDRLLHSKEPLHRDIAAFLASVQARAAGLPPFEFLASVLEREIKPKKTGWTLLIERLGPEAREPVEALLAKALEHGRKQVANLTSFLSGLDNDVSEIKREAEHGTTGIRVMTIHGAKGLEAPVVILPDTTSPRTRKGDHIFQHEASGAWLWSPDPKADCRYIAKLRAQAQQAEEREDMRLLYVAMTRARDLLILCGFQYGPKSKDPDQPKDNWFNLLRSALPLIGDEKVGAGFDFTYSFWGRYLNVADFCEAKPIDTVPLPEWIDQNPPPQLTPPRRIAPSILAPDGALPATLSPLATQTNHRFKRGRLIHELLQHLPNADTHQWLNLAKSRLKRELELSEAEQNAISTETLKIMHDPQFAALFGPGSRAEAAIIGRGPGLPDDMVVNGTVDRLVVTKDEVLVLDFKTNRPPPQSIEDVAQVYLNQMAAYRALLQASWPDKIIRCALLWTDGPHLMGIPDQVLDRALRVIAALPRL
ncbi:double-strand break repair helicase AddA [Candidatus Phycosocius spiralis]|uniref:DNA 3'-5' helicase n=1 Tax=Candidatus Phycosocius spiralis TaxID=2815099 RepID=A0ABQ4PXG8_9PROT|nr:double-strand break repair helicase AddA [Candidatus Phycosocius spiralis]GIU67654.1 double-strand break repair helicase AddA [Candidatus Phycosocius spiralis]